MNLAAHIRNVPDFPKPGIQFKDITTLLLEPPAFRAIIDCWAERYGARGIDVIVGMDARGFVFAGALAYVLGLPLVLARKHGKLPAATVSETFQLEYGSDTVELHADAIRPGQRALLIDDLLATGGTMAAIARLVERLDGIVEAMAFVVELPPLNGRAALAGYEVDSLVTFMVE